MKLRIGILGTRGIPNQYGGFEQFAQYLSAGLVKNGHEVTVYNAHTHNYQHQEWNGVQIKHCYDPEHWLGTAGQFIYDFNCVADARKKKYDIVLQLGYTSSSVWLKLLPKETVIITNMDGLEWKRSKYNQPVRWFLKYAEKIAVKNSDYLIADSIEIKKYLHKKYQTQIQYIPYGAEIFSEVDENILSEFGLQKGQYSLLMARMEPENNIEIILEGVRASRSENSFIVVGNIHNSFGKYLFKKFSHDKRIKFIGSMYEQNKLHALRSLAHLYFHGHSVGGTNPSLLEAMSDKALIVAHRNVFNSCILQNDAFYFSTADDVSTLLDKNIHVSVRRICVNNNYNKIQNEFNWKKIINDYENYMLSVLPSLKNTNQLYHEEIIYN